MSIGRNAITRRQFVRQAGALGAGGLSLAGLVAGCGRQSDNPNSLVVDNWPAYIDQTTDGVTGTADRFRAATGIDLRYTEGVNDNQEYFAKIQPRLGTGRTIEPDLMVLTGWMAARLIRLGWLDPLPLELVPNLVNLDPLLKNPVWDPTGRYTLPWSSVLIGIGYNRSVTGRDIGSVSDLFDPQFKGKVGMLTEMRDTIGLILMGLGRDPATVSSFEEAAPAFERLERAARDGQVRAFTGNDFIDDLSSGNFAVCMAWGGDVLRLGRDNPDVRFVIPEEGGLYGTDAMVMPKGARHRASAARWMNFVYEPAQAARITAAVQGLSPVAGAAGELAKFDAALAANPLLFPDEALKQRLRPFADLAEDVELQFDQAFSRITSA
ncbi:MAG: PotD/PotF family extracellular solute-binding protein [Vicinamibacterales bacterium]